MRFVGCANGAPALRDGDRRRQRRPANLRHPGSPVSELLWRLPPLSERHGVRCLQSFIATVVPSQSLPKLLILFGQFGLEQL